MDIILAIATLIGGVAAACYFWDKWKEKRSILRVKTKKDKNYLEYKHQGKIYSIPIEIREVLFNNQHKKQMWVQPFKHPNAKNPMVFEKYEDVKRSVKSCIRQEKFHDQLEDLINKGTIIIKGSKEERSLKN
jgi:hypothetical protein